MQISMFEGKNPFKITKPLRLIELFAGIGAQAKALENLGIEFEHYRICEFDKYAVSSYNAVHGTNFATSDITKIHAADLGIVETDKYEYIMTYSFPCTDLSKAGKQQGMSRDSGTRSGLLWEVERLLIEITKEGGRLPQILLMENVPDVLSEKNRKDFFSWCELLESLGYTSKYAILNAKDFGVPQNRKRCFMLSWLGEDYYYDFPHKQPLVVRLKNVLEPSVDEKYYLSEKTITMRAGSRMDDNFIKCEHIAQLEGDFEMANRVYSPEGLCPTIRTMQGGGLEPKILEDFYKSRQPREYKEVVPTLRSGREGLKVVEPMALDEQNGYLRKDGIVGTLTTDGSSPKHNNRVVEPIVWDGFNQSIRKDSSCVGTLTRNCGADLKRNGQGIIETTKQYSRPHGFNKGGVNESEVFPAVRCSSTEDGNNGIIDGIRVRKLTPKECWRLMGFDDESFSRAEKEVSATQLYKQAGNSIVVTVLMAIFGQIFDINWGEKINKAVKKITLSNFEKIHKNS